MNNDIRFNIQSVCLLLLCRPAYKFLDDDHKIVYTDSTSQGNIEKWKKFFYFSDLWKVQSFCLFYDLKEWFWSLRVKNSNKV